LQVRVLPGARQTPGQRLKLIALLAVLRLSWLLLLVASVALSHAGRLRSEAAFAALAGVNPIRASSGQVTRHRLNRSGDRQLFKLLERYDRSAMELANLIARCARLSSCPARSRVGAAATTRAGR
jgi:transposase